MAAPRNENIREKILSAAEDLLASEKCLTFLLLT